MEKKIYQRPETNVVLLNTSCFMTGGSQLSGIGGNTNLGGAGTNGVITGNAGISRSRGIDWDDWDD